MSTTIALAHLDKGQIWHTLEAINAHHDREMRLFAVWCARQVQHLMPDQRCTNTLDVAERYANGEASSEELDAARYHANAAAAPAYVAVRAAQTDELRRVIACIDSGADPYPK